MDAAVRLDLPEEMELSELLYSLTTGHVSALSWRKEEKQGMEMNSLLPAGEMSESAVG